MTDYPEPAIAHRSTHHLSEDHKAILKDMVSDMPMEHIRHVGNHMHNMADQMHEDMSNKVTMKDFEKAMAPNDSGQELTQKND